MRKETLSQHRKGMHVTKTTHQDCQPKWNKLAIPNFFMASTDWCFQEIQNLNP